MHFADGKSNFPYSRSELKTYPLFWLSTVSRRDQRERRRSSLPLSNRLSELFKLSIWDIGSYGACMGITSASGTNLDDATDFFGALNSGSSSGLLASQIRQRHEIALPGSSLFGC